MPNICVKGHFVRKL